MDQRGFLYLIILIIVLGLWALSPQNSRAQRGEAPLPCQGGLKEITLSGEVIEFSFPVATIKTEDGQKYQVRLGPWWFWAERDYELKPGEWVEIKGFVSGHLVFPRVIRTSDRVLHLRDRRGIPLWRRGPGWGRGMSPGGPPRGWWRSKGHGRSW